MKFSVEKKKTYNSIKENKAVKIRLQDVVIVTVFFA